MKNFKKHIEDLEAQNRRRSLKLPGGIDLTSNDYLGMSEHPALRETAIKALESGIALGAGGSRLLRGHTEEHQNLETFAAQYFSCEKALYFATGFQANYALFTTLPTRHDVILYDSLIHASARDGINASAAKSIKIPHNDLEQYESALSKNSANKIWIAVESLYSMDGDIAPVKELYDLAKRHDAYLIIDEAHATGVLGHTGKGLSFGIHHNPSPTSLTPCAKAQSEAPLPSPLRERGGPGEAQRRREGEGQSERNHPENLITLLTCGKAIGVAGGLICASADIIDYMINTARPFIYSTAPPPLQALLVQKSLEILGSVEGNAKREKLKTLSAHAQKLFGAHGKQHGTHIVPIILGENQRALAAATELQTAGFDIRAIRPPTVPEGTARLRLSLSTNLTEDILESVANHLTPYLQDVAA